MRCLICPDTSEFQPVLLKTDKFGRRVLIFRVAFGAHYQDRNFLAMAGVVKWLYEHHLIDGAILYQVWLKSATAAEHFAFAKQLIGPTPPAWLMGVMLDLETWSSASYRQFGDHSAAINALWAKFCAWGGGWTFCGLYANQGDLKELAPKRDRRAWVIVASYGSSLVYKNVTGAIGQQYTNGQTSTPSIGGVRLPTRSAGFRGSGGLAVSVACDHNVFDPKRFPTGAALRAFMRPAARPPVVKPAPSTTPKPPPAVYYHHDGHGAMCLATPDGQGAWWPTNAGKLEFRTYDPKAKHGVPRRAL